MYVSLGDDISPPTGEKVWRLSRGLQKSPPPWLIDWIPSYNKLLLEFDDEAVSCRAVANCLNGINMRGGELPPARAVVVPVKYDGLDLPEISARTGLSIEEVVRLHSEPTYRVYAVGFTPGFPFMAEVPRKLRLPRRKSPRLKIPALSVAMAGVQTGIYPQATPGGWHLLGRSLKRVYDPFRAEPFLLQAGDSVRFVAAEGEVPAPPQRVELLAKEGEQLFEVLEPGLLTIPVDEGRFGLGRYGLARSGPLDRYSFTVANRLLGNDGGAVALEVNLLGPELRVLRDTALAVAGYGPTISGGNEARVYHLTAGETLRFKGVGDGARTYIAIPGGFAVARFMGSSSPDLTGGIGRQLREGDILRSAKNVGKLLQREWRMPPLRRINGRVRLRIYPGPQASEEAIAALTENVFTVGNADRMGLRLQGGKVPGGEITSEGIPIGAVQVPSAGDPILLLSDRGTIGGYRKPAVLHPADLWRAGQLKSGDEIEFVLSGEGKSPMCFYEL